MKVKALRFVKTDILKGSVYYAKGIWTEPDGEDYYQIILDNERIVLYHVSHFKTTGEKDERKIQ